MEWRTVGTSKLQPARSAFFEAKPDLTLGVSLAGNASRLRHVIEPTIDVTASRTSNVIPPAHSVEELARLFLASERGIGEAHLQVILIDLGMRQVLGFYLGQNFAVSLGGKENRATPAGQQGSRSKRILIFARRRSVNLWAAVVRIVELFVLGGKAGHALIAFLATILAIVIVASSIASSGRTSVGNLLDTINPHPVTKKALN